jgi:hypothetical protein
LLLTDYANPEFNWSSNPHSLQPAGEQLAHFEGLGLTRDQASLVTASGFVFPKIGSNIIDRYYGGPLFSYDGRTRFSPQEFKSIALEQTRKIPPYPLIRASSLGEVQEYVKDLNDQHPNRTLAYRGQQSHHRLQRKFTNPYLDHPELGETSLLPSVWRHMLNSTSDQFPNFTGIPMLGWSAILYKQWPIEEIRRREAALANTGEFLFTISEMEDCSDELLKEFAKFRGYLHLEEAIFQNGLLTMMQHYGLPSPVLDLTTDLDVAIFFATHKFASNQTHSTYSFNGTNSKNAILYVMLVNENEMHQHERNKVMSYAKPERPKRQSCVVCSTNAWSLNLPAHYLVGAIRLDFDLSEPSKYSVRDLFPDEGSDPFLAAWAATGSYPLTKFQN